MLRHICLVFIMSQITTLRLTERAARKTEKRDHAHTTHKQAADVLAALKGPYKAAKQAEMDSLAGYECRKELARAAVLGSQIAELPSSGQGCVVCLDFTNVDLFGVEDVVLPEGVLEGVLHVNVEHAPASQDLMTEVVSIEGTGKVTLIDPLPPGWCKSAFRNTAILKEVQNLEWFRRQDDQGDWHWWSSSEEREGVWYGDLKCRVFYDTSYTGDEESDTSDEEKSDPSDEEQPAKKACLNKD